MTSIQATDDKTVKMTEHDGWAEGEYPCGHTVRVPYVPGRLPDVKAAEEFIREHHPVCTFKHHTTREECLDIKNWSKHYASMNNVCTFFEDGKRYQATIMHDSVVMSPAGVGREKVLEAIAEAVKNAQPI